MKIKYWLHLFILISMLFTIALADEGEIIGQVTLILGKVYTKSKSDTNWVVVQLNSPVSRNDYFKTGFRSRAEISIHSSQIIRIGENTVSQITEELNRIQVKSDRGKTWLNIILYDNQDFVVRTPTAVAAIRGTVYRINCDTTSSMFRVYQGTVAVQPIDAGTDSVFLVSRGKEFVLTKDVNRYIRSERKAIQDYLKNQQDMFDEFQKREQEQFQEYQKNDQQAFTKFRNLNYRLLDFDAVEDSMNNWVQWNQGRDSLISR